MAFIVFTLLFCLLFTHYLCRRLLKSVIPYTRMLSPHDGYLIPLEDKCFRINPSTIGFTYGGKIHCVGLVTNIIGESTDPKIDQRDPKNFTAQLQFSINEMILSLVSTKKKDILVINPIAIYYDTSDPTSKVQSVHKESV